MLSVPTTNTVLSVLFIFFAQHPANALAVFLLGAGLLKVSISQCLPHTMSTGNLNTTGVLGVRKIRISKSANITVSLEVMASCYERNSWLLLALFALR